VAPYSERVQKNPPSAIGRYYLNKKKREGRKDRCEVNGGERISQRGKLSLHAEHRKGKKGGSQKKGKKKTGGVGPGEERRRQNAQKPERVSVRGGQRGKSGVAMGEKEKGRKKAFAVG